MPGAHRRLSLTAAVRLSSLIGACAGTGSAEKAPAAAAPERPPVPEVPAEEVRAQIAVFVDELARAHGFDRDEVAALIDSADVREDILAAMTRPAEARPWYRYRPIFLTADRIRDGVAFWNGNAALLERAEVQYGVPPAIITAIIGVETSYGRITGRHRVLDALVTLGFHYPPRAAFFRGELGEFLLLAREEGLDPQSVTGSYAGAMGKGQFISSSYRHYAVDFDGDGRRDLLDSTADAIGSVANYFREHGWRTGEAVAVPAQVNGEPAPALAGERLKPTHTVADLRAAGVEPATTLPGTAPATLITLEQENGPEYWVGLTNFYVITRYNRSPLYAMAVYQLSEALREARARGETPR
jgi:membrane-bound lytic murein transglycosylase B